MDLKISDSLWGSYMAKLGEFVFRASTVSFGKFARENKYNWKVQEVAGANSFVLGGFEEPEKIIIGGEIFRGYHSLYRAGKLDDLRKMAKTREPYKLTFTDIYKTKSEGRFVICSIKEDASYFNSTGIPAKTSFTLELLRYEDN